MSTAFAVRGPEDDVVEMRLVFGPRTTIRNWKRYSLNSNFETPSDGWSFTIGAEDIPSDLVQSLYPGQLVQFWLNGFCQGTGNIDTITRNPSRGGGTEWTIEGRDVFGPVVDSHVDPRKQFKKDTTLESFVRECLDFFTPAGGEWEYVFDSAAENQIKTGRPRGGRGSKAGQGTGKGGGRAGKKLDQLVPGQNEGLFTFLSKILHRQGLHAHPSLDGSTVIVSQPDYESAPTHTLLRTPGYSNIREGTVKWSLVDQPSIIISDGFSGSGSFGHSQLYCKMLNPFTGFDQQGVLWPEIKVLWDQYPQAKILDFESVTFGLSKLRWPRKYHARPLFLHDESARTLDELERFTRREMSMRVRKALTVSYTVQGHGLLTEVGHYIPFHVDTMIEVRDIPGGLEAGMWVLGRTFEKSRDGGSTTKLDLIIPGSLFFGEA